MKYLILIFLLLYSDLGESKGNKKIKITNDKPDNSQYVLLQEYNIYNTATYVNISAVYTSSSGVSIGLNSSNIRLNGYDLQNYENDSYFMVSKIFELTEYYNITIGSQYGYEFPHPENIHIFHFIDNQITLADYFDDFEDISLHGGPYYVNPPLSTTPQIFGGQCGIEYTREPFKFQADYISGHNNLSGANINLHFNLNRNISFYIGTSIPETNSGNYYAGVVGFSFTYDK